MTLDARAKRLLLSIELGKESEDRLANKIKAKSDRLKKKWRAAMDGRGKLAPRTRADHLVTDEATYIEINNIFRSGGRVALTDKLTPGVTYSGNSRSLKRLEQPIPIISDEEITRIYVPRWKDTGPFLKTYAWISEALKYEARARAFTLHLSDDVIKAAIASKSEFASHIQKAMVRNFKRKLKPHGLEAPEFFFWVEYPFFGLTTRPHLHGVIIMPERLSAQAEKAIHEALKQAGGEWNHKAHGNQLHTRPLIAGREAGWAWYSGKIKETSERRLGYISPTDATLNLTAVTSALNRDARSAYEKARQTSGELLPGQSSQMS